MIVPLASHSDMHPSDTEPPTSDRLQLARYRNYLLLLARSSFDARLRRKLSESDIVQQTMIKACRAQSRLRKRDPAHVVAWLRRILVRTMQDAVRDLHRGKRDIALERSLESSVTQSSMRLGDLIPSDQATPRTLAIRNERLASLSDALARLPAPQRDAILMKHCQGLTLAEIGEYLDRTPIAVASLLRRGLKKLRTNMEVGSAP